MRRFALVISSCLCIVVGAGCGDDDCPVRQFYAVAYDVTLRSRTPFAAQQVSLRLHTAEGTAEAPCTMPPAFACGEFQGTSFRATVTALGDGSVRVSVPERGGLPVFTLTVLKSDGSPWGSTSFPSGYDRCGEAVSRGPFELLLD